VATGNVDTCGWMLSTQLTTMVINYETGKEQNVFPVHMSSILLGAVVGTGSLWPYVSSCFIQYQRQTE
jgi:hypothetical protein